MPVIQHSSRTTSKSSGSSSEVTASAQRTYTTLMRRVFAWASPEGQSYMQKREEES
ncbi:Protein of unknown function [Pyronema omphalodes CBS 100304]|uniref:Uncharacterized protein n=1 Tax=Pyronema omphalodes (strain CBS 100304) TaxID=1076935 RepID=U4LFV0_PYROM|nr:Protein of unknown function [Pyronema omphalodes CBS 100304]